MKDVPKLKDVCQQDTPRLVIEYNNNNLTWGIVGTVPFLPLVGYLARIQSDLFFKTPKTCDPIALVVVFDGKDFDYFLNPSIPVNPLVGILEMIKLALLQSIHAANEMQRNHGINLYGTDGQPLKR